MVIITLGEEGLGIHQDQFHQRAQSKSCRSHAHNSSMSAIVTNRKLVRLRRKWDCYCYGIHLNKVSTLGTHPKIQHKAIKLLQV